MIKYFIVIIFASILVRSQSQFQEFLIYVNSLSTQAQKDAAVDSFMSYAQSEGIPFIEDSTANFIYRGNANQIHLVGDLNGWSITTDFMLNKLTGTDFYYYSQNFELNARIDYKFVLNQSNWILDPNNPNTVAGGFGPNSELAMPDYQQPWEINYQSGIEYGSLEASSLFSSHTNKTYQLRIYLPPSYQVQSGRSFPVVYFQDGTDYLNLGSAKNILDNLIDAQMIDPVIGVFVKPTNRNREYAFEDRYKYSDFFVQELVPFIDSNYRTLRNPDNRLIIGDSFGGNISALISYLHPDIFSKVGLHSAAFWPNNYEVYNLIVNGNRKEIKYYSVWGTYEGLYQNMRNFRDNLIGIGYEFQWEEYPEGHSWGLWRANIDNILEYFFPFGTTSVSQDSQMPAKFELYQNYPNPFNPETTISYYLPDAANVTLSIYNIQGELIAILLNEQKSAGRHSVNYNPTGLSSGVYFYRLAAGKYSTTKKLSFIK